jgi:hypothetical protein
MVGTPTLPRTYSPRPAQISTRKPAKSCNSRSLQVMKATDRAYPSRISLAELM